MSLERAQVIEKTGCERVKLCSLHATGDGENTERSRGKTERACKAALKAGTVSCGNDVWVNGARRSKRMKLKSAHQ